MIFTTQAGEIIASTGERPSFKTALTWHNKLFRAYKERCAQGETEAALLFRHALFDLGRAIRDAAEWRRASGQSA